MVAIQTDTSGPPQRPRRPPPSYPEVALSYTTPNVSKRTTPPENRDVILVYSLRLAPMVRPRSGVCETNAFYDTVWRIVKRGRFFSLYFDPRRTVPRRVCSRLEEHYRAGKSAK